MNPLLSRIGEILLQVFFAIVGIIGFLSMILSVFSGK
jgi:hypothetical protein